MTDKTFVPTLALVASIFLSALLTAFATDKPQAVMAMGAAGEVVDAALSARVDRTLKTDFGLAGAKLQITTRGAVVTLSGLVPNEDAMRRALDLASNVRGVREVRSSMLVEPIR